MDTFIVSHAHSLRDGVADKPAIGNYPPAGPIRLPDRTPDGRFVNLSNWIITHVVVSHATDEKELAKWMAATTSHITVVSLVPRTKTLRPQLRQERSGACPEACSAVLQPEKHLYGYRCSHNTVNTFVDRFCRKTNHDEVVQTAVAAKFVLEVFADTFCIVHRCITGEFS